MTDLEKELREFLAKEAESARGYYASHECDAAYYDGKVVAFERVIEWLDGER